MSSNKLKVASLFSGCGGSDLGMVGGFEYLGKWYDELPFDIVYAADFDKWAVDTYNKNFKHKAVCADVTEVDFNQIPDVDIMIGGFPCQSFSTVNPTKDTNDDRANLYKQIVRFLQTKQPKYFICENVKGLITLKGGSIVNKIMGEFANCGYRVKFQLLKAVEYGIPQRRERVIIVGIRNDIVYNYEYPKALNTEENATPLSTCIEKLAIEEQKYYFSERAVQGVKNAKNNMKRGLWQDLSKPCLTLTAHLAKTSMNSRDPILLVEPKKELYRRFTPREAARIQSFPDNFRLNDSESKSYKQIGNAVPPVLMWVVANQLKKAIIESLGMTEEETQRFFDTTPASAFCPVEENLVKDKSESIKQLNFLELFDQYKSNPIVENKPIEVKVQLVKVVTKLVKKELDVDKTKNCLISIVKADNMEHFLDCSAKIYYTGKHFPSTIALNKLYYFMPYLKGKGIRDLYYIKIARIGTRKEGQPNEDRSDFRLVFEIEYVGQLFDDYHMVALEIWHSFTDTKLKNIMQI